MSSTTLGVSSSKHTLQSQEGGQVGLGVVGGLVEGQIEPLVGVGVGEAERKIRHGY